MYARGKNALAYMSTDSESSENEVGGLQARAITTETPTSPESPLHANRVMTIYPTRRNWVPRTSPSRSTCFSNAGKTAGSPRRPDIAQQRTFSAIDGKLPGSRARTAAGPPAIRAGPRKTEDTFHPNSSRHRREVL